jgi:hypothetical protein
VQSPTKPLPLETPAVIALLVVLAASKPAVARPALDELAVRVVEQAEAAKPEAPVAVSVDGNPAVLARAFASALSAELASRRRAPTVLEASTAAEAEAQARTRDLRTLVRVTVQLDAGKLTARGDAIHTWVNFWSGADPTRLGPSAALSATVDADAQALALGAPTSTPPPATGPLKLALTSLVHLPSPPAAIAAGDLDGDGKPEIAVLTDDGVSVLDGEGKLKWRWDLSTLPPAPSPPREPFGALAVLPSPPRLAVASGRRARGGLFPLKNAEVRPADHPVLLDGVPVRLAAGLNLFEKGPAASVPFTTLSSRGGVTLVVFPDGTAGFTRSGPVAGHFSGAGAASTLADLDGDGTPEVFLSSTRFFPDGDPLQVLALSSAEAMQARTGQSLEGPALWQGATPRGRAIVATAADLDGDKAEEVLLGVWLPDGSGEVLVAHRIPDK